ncbi:MAG TPA: DsrE family protein [Rhodocyclaceae bacterium]|nr:DsrE family protein [Rhodocyclaceae bacterium]HNH36442.1 DsrE family protein [Rhodocyclaceae bacterium]
MTPTLRLAAASLFLALSPACPAQQAAPPQDRVILQVSDDDPKKWNLALNNARNIQADLGGKVEIEVVAYGPGIGMLKAEALVANRVQDALAAGIRVVACENTMTSQKISRDDMINGIGYVKAGVIEIMRRQQAGWAYIRP